MEKLRRDDPVTLGPYRVLGRLGSGGMGQVFFAEGNSGPVALKVIHPGLAEDRQFRDRFRREVRAAQRVVGPYTATVLDADPDGDPPWMATEYVPGPTLQGLVEKAGPLPLERVSQLGAELATGLSQVHSVGVVHRDLKPKNVLLPPGGPARVIDFGIALVADATSVTSTGLAPGSVGFMAPEQASSTARVGPAADVFALGALLFFAATGEPAFGTGTAPVVMYRVVHEEPNLSAVPDPNLRSLISSCLAKRPDQRPSPEQVRAACLGQVGGWSVKPSDRSPLAAQAAPTELYATATPITEPVVSESRPTWTSSRLRILLVASALVVTVLIAGGAATWPWTEPIVNPVVDDRTVSPTPVPTQSTPTPPVPTSSKPTPSPTPTPSPSPTQTTPTPTTPSPTPSRRLQMPSVTVVNLSRSKYGQATAHLTIHYQVCVGSAPASLRGPYIEGVRPNAPNAPGVIVTSLVDGTVIHPGNCQVFSDTWATEVESGRVSVHVTPRGEPESQWEDYYAADFG